jgi:hypothetical protein
MKSMRAWGAGLVAAAVLAAGAAQAKIEKKPEPGFGGSGHIHGYLVTPAGQGITGMVALRTEDGRLIEMYDTAAYRNGRFDIDNLFPGTYRLSVESLGTTLNDMRKPEDKVVKVSESHVSRPKLVCR